MGIHILTDEQLKVLTRKGFAARYMFFITICDSYKEAYEKVEDEYEEILGEQKYSSYDSFRKTLTRKIK